MKIKINYDTPATKLGYGYIPVNKRGKIITNKEQEPVIRPLKRVPSNAEYASQHNTTSRQGSKLRRGY